jgi:dienelactone hydrolase
LVPQAAVAFLTPRPEKDPAGSSAITRWGLERGSAPLGLAVHDVLAAHAQLASLSEVDPVQIGFVGIGSGGPAALWAARLLGGKSPVFLVHAPVSLYWDGPRSGQDSPPQPPWPSTLLVADRFGASLDPWMAAEGLEGRLRWLDPRSGDAQPWVGPPTLRGEAVETLSEGMRPPEEKPGPQ